MIFFQSGGWDAEHLAKVIDHLHAKHPLDAAVLHTWDSVIGDDLTERSVPMYVGGAYIPHPGLGTRYFEGMMNDGWRWESIRASLQAAGDALASSSPVGWYLTEEGDLTAMAANEPLRLRYEWMLVELMRNLHLLKPVPFIWSPWGSGKVTSRAVAACKRTVVGARDWLRSQGLGVEVEVHFQDGVGAGHHTAAVAAAWVASLNGIGCPVQVNMELFRVANGVVVPGDRDEILARAAFYRSKGLRVGACWEARHWWYPGGWTANHEEGP